MVVTGLASVVGLATGTFLTSLIRRVPRSESIRSPGPVCPRCQAPVKVRDTIPLLGWLLLRGTCRHCRQPISPRYPLVELGTGALFVMMAVRFGADPVLPAFLYLAAVGVALALIDVDVQRLPDAIVLPSYPVLLALLALAAVAGSDSGDLLRAVLGSAALYGFYFVLCLVHPAGMGFGDVKLAGVLGMALGWVGWAVWGLGLFAGFFLGGLWGIGLIVMRRGTRKSKVPFGPFMLLGALLAVLFGPSLVDNYLSLAST